MLSAGAATIEDMLKIRAKMDAFGDQVQGFANAAEVSKEYLLGPISKVLDLAQQGSQCAFYCMTQVELLFGHGIRKWMHVSGCRMYGVTSIAPWQS
jgi:hypothetical protein